MYFLSLLNHCTMHSPTCAWIIIFKTHIILNYFVKNYRIEFLKQKVVITLCYQVLLSKIHYWISISKNCNQNISTKKKNSLFLILKL
jgi:hypothetical protein